MGLILPKLQVRFITWSTNEDPKIIQKRRRQASCAMVAFFSKLLLKIIIIQQFEIELKKPQFQVYSWVFMHAEVAELKNWFIWRL